MAERHEYYDPTFRPRIRRFAEVDHAEYFEAYKVPDNAYPAPTLNGMKAAYWLPKPSDSSQILPIVAVSIPASKRDVDLSSDWMLGTATLDEIKRRAAEIEELEESVNPVGTAVLEFAVSGPYVVHEALANIARLCPMPKGILRN